MLYDEPLVRLNDAENNLLSVSPVVNTMPYHDAFMRMPVSRPVAESAYAQAGRILQKADGKDEEYLVAIDARTGVLVVDNLDREGHSRSTTFVGGEVEVVQACAHGVITIHNHPHNREPSYRDVMTASKNSAVFASVVIGHDGDVWYVSAPSENIADELRRYYNQAKNELGDRAELYALGKLIRRARKVGLAWMKLR